MSKDTIIAMLAVVISIGSPCLAWFLDEICELKLYAPLWFAWGFFTAATMYTLISWL